MPRKHAALVLGACILIGALVVLGVKSMAEKAGGESELPLKKFVVTLDAGQRESLFEEFKRFADKQGFAIRIAPVRPDGEHFLVEMWRSDFKILAVNSEEPSRFKVGVYDNDSQGVPQSYVESLVIDLKVSIGNVQGVAITETDAR